ncbi:hypothetical protein G7078_08625 [Sphingomonas sinipercae]|uniref:Uncharacterized protein n=1 Tax=Sphingomonas sinipercae TaxID=2714944 RepID=A0A6G7ZPL3_9SPHN|nr:hypothetical protein [Sphingomonas sinipercae]QIL02840.1 hypothetical protein G7078_08625 [Sphingomonas sinipercae]
MQSAAKALLLAGAAAALAIPAVAQVQTTTTNTPAPAPAPSPAPSTGAATPATNTSPASPSPSRSTAEETVGEGETVELELKMPPPPPPVEYPGFARRDPTLVGALDPRQIGLGERVWGAASGPFLETLMRRMDTPLASRWLHIALRNALIAEAKAPRGVNPVDWAAERAWLLLRMGEADAARMLVTGVDTNYFTPKMTQVALQSALATSDPAGICPLTKHMGKTEQQILPLAQAMCSALEGEPASAAAQIDSARRRGKIGGIDLSLAQKVVGAASDTGRAVTIEWEPVDALNAWRFGLSTATAMSPPDRLLASATPQLHAWYARAPMIPLQARLNASRMATGLGVFSSQALVDIYSLIYDATDPNDLSGTDAWQLRLAFAGRDQDIRLDSIRKLLDNKANPLQREASRALVAAAAARIVPSADLQEDAPELIAAMLAGGLEKEAAEWASAVGGMDNKYADRCWAMLSLGTANPDGVMAGRVSSFIDRDESEGKKRSALLVAGLAGLGRIDLATAARLNRKFGLGIARSSRWTALVDAAAARGQSGSVLVLSGTGFQASGFGQLPSSHLFHSVSALKRTGQDFTARMIAAEALSRA